MAGKQQLIVSYEKMSEELAAAFAEKYPKGLQDYLPDVKTIVHPVKGDKMYVVEIETPSAIYLVKVQMKVDDVEAVSKWMDAEDEEEENESGENNDEGGELPDDNIAQYSTGDDADGE